MLLRRGLGRVKLAEALDFIRRDGRFMRPLPESLFLTTREAMQEEILQRVNVCSGKEGLDPLSPETNDVISFERLRFSSRKVSNQLD
jgi:hypothetical protein